MLNKTSLNNPSAYNNVHLVWVAGHHGNVGNENTDELARKGSQMSFHGPEHVLGLTYLAIETSIRNDFLVQFKEYWMNSTTCNHAKILISGSFYLSIENTEFLFN